MIKIVVALHPAECDRTLVEFSCYLAKLTGSDLTGVLLENVAAREREPITLPGKLGNNQPAARAMNWFYSACAEHGVAGRIHRDRGIPLAELIIETRFADLLVINGGLSFSEKYEGDLSELAREVLRESECPVIVAPQHAVNFGDIIFTYDGSRQSVFAMKQFSRLFPELHNLPVTVLQVNRQGTWEDSCKYILQEWLKSHYNTFEFKALKGDTSTELLGYLLRKENTCIVMGAYGEHALSFFRSRIHAELLIKTVPLPVFISHG